MVSHNLKEARMILKCKNERIQKFLQKEMLRRNSNLSLMMKNEIIKHENFEIYDLKNRVYELLKRFFRLFFVGKK